MTKKDFDMLILQSVRASFDEFTLLKARQVVLLLDENELENIAFYLSTKNKNGFYDFKDFLNALAEVKKLKILDLIKKTKIKNATLPRFQNEMLLFGYFLKKECQNLPDFVREFLKQNL